MSHDTTTRSHNDLSKPAQAASEQQMSATEAAVEYFTQYARERPEVVALWAFGVGFVLGWKLKPW